VQWCFANNIPRIIVSALLAQVLHHREVTIECCIVQWIPVKPTPRLLVSALLTQTLYYSEVTLIYCTVQWRAAIPMPPFLVSALLAQMVKLERRFNTPFGTLEKSLSPVLDEQIC